MRILAYSYYPFFGEHLAGGLQVSARSLGLGFAGRGHEVRVLCPECEFPPLDAPGVEVRPVLREQHAETISPEDVSHNLREIRRAADSVDAVWSLDRPFPVAVDQPVVLSLSAVCYENELSALFGLAWDHLVVPSDYVMRLVDDWLSRESERLGRRGRQSIPPPLDPVFLRRAETARLRSKLGLHAGRRYLLFPHRPEPAKGHELALRTLSELLRHDDRFHLLIPRPPLARWLDVAAEAGYADRIEEEAARLGLSDHVTFHDWIEYSDLPAYFSLGECSLFLSRHPESFGLSLVQSIGCGTFVVSSGTGALTGTVPPGWGHVVVSGLDPGAVARAVLAGCPEGDLRRGQAWIAETYNPKRIIDAYLDCFQALKRTRDVKHDRRARAPIV